MRFFNLDCHISVIADIKQIFENLGHEVVSWSLSGHNWIFGKQPDKVDIINQSSWWNLDPKMCDDFYERYKNELSTFDGFICTYPPVFSMLYEKFDKPIILQIPIRYEVPFHNNSQMWLKFNEYLRQGIDSGKIIPVANSEYDKKYFEFFVNRECNLIPSICEYTDMKWLPKVDKFLYYSRLPINLPSNLIDKSKLGKYRWQDLGIFKGVVMIPYNCSTMSIFEYYTANIPIFCPSYDFMIELYRHYQNYVLSELSWNRYFKIKPESVIDCDREKDPNRYDNIDIMKEWIKFSDFYNQDWMKHIVYFDSFDDLQVKLNTTDLENTHLQMKNFNTIRREMIYDKWVKLLSCING